MTWTESGLLVTNALAVIAGLWAILRERNKPKIDAATSDQIRQQVNQISVETNARRDFRILQMENWAFEKVRPWGRDMVTKFDQQSDLIREMAALLGRDVPKLHLEPFPEMPELLVDKTDKK